jgi:hypothetical protein
MNELQKQNAFRRDWTIANFILAIDVANRQPRLQQYGCCGQYLFARRCWSFSPLLVFFTSKLIKAVAEEHQLRCNAFM